MIAELSRHKSTLRMLAGFVRPYRGTLLAAATALVITAGVTLALGQGLRLLIDQGFLAGSEAALNRSVALILLLTLIIALGTFARFYLISWLGERVSADIRRAVFDHLVELQTAYFETNRSTEIISRLTTDTTLLQSIVGSSLSMALRSALTFVGALVMLAVTQLELTLIVLGTVPLVLLPILVFGRRVRRLARRSQDSVADVGSRAGEAIEQIKTVQSYTREELEKAAFARQVEAAFAVGRQRIRQRALLIATVILMVFGAIAGLLWKGGHEVLTGSLSAGELGAFLFYAILMAVSVATLSEVLGEVQRALGAAERLMELLQVPARIKAPAAPVDADDLEPSLTLAAVTFAYPSRPGQPALQALDLTVEAGTLLALVGPSGAGKSTLFELLLRFHDPKRGVIQLGGVDLRQLDPRALRRQIALVPQQPILFSGTLWHNIGYGDPAASKERVMEAARAAQAHDFIQALPNGYDSDLGERGVRLSGGQRQRIAIARAILKNPRILLLDEATSALDAESEHAVQAALGRLMAGRTTIVIAHRLATVQNAERIALIDQGRLMDQGSHAELLQRSPLYRRLAELQFQEPPKTGKPPLSGPDLRAQRL
ncbi:ABC transporter transmembrane domain-containing protein [Motiliproteus sp. SC1-56]|uniref:ABC transporter transmembrane domain-containing protein n=1 Tax=Motiliproteus sp. SC1-56 TaxID=2799565 RepID=UPI001A8D5481|nr:ABC transporter transmembrane domain-containing protein [Motiliproteus sp. SC1-56]